MEQLERFDELGVGMCCLRFLAGDSQDGQRVPVSDPNPIAKSLIAHKWDLF